MKLFIPVICYNHSCNTEFMFSLIRLTWDLKDAGIPFTLLPITFESLIPRARNAAVAFFMSDPDATHLLFIDSDIEFKSEDVIKMIKTDKNVICAGYAQKHLPMENLKAVLASGKEDLEMCTRTSVHVKLPIKDEEVIEAFYATTGFLMIKKNVFERLFAKYPERAYRNDIDGYESARADMFYDVFRISIHPTTKRYESEDYGFSSLLHELGEPIWVYTDISLRHLGWFGYPANLKKQIKVFLANNPDKQSVDDTFTIKQEKLASVNDGEEEEITPESGESK